MQNHIHFLYWPEKHKCIINSLTLKLISSYQTKLHLKGAQSHLTFFRYFIGTYWRICSILKKKCFGWLTPWQKYPNHRHIKHPWHIYKRISKTKSVAWVTVTSTWQPPNKVKVFFNHLQMFIFVLFMLLFSLDIFLLEAPFNFPNYKTIYKINLLPVAL